MKRFISAVLIPCLLLQFFGCYSFRPLGSNEDINNYPETRVMFTKNNGQQIKAKAKDCEFMTGHKFMLYGEGISFNKKTLGSKYFRGDVNEESIDSVKNISLDSKDYLVCWLKDSTRISFNKNNYCIFTLNPDSSYWLIKNFDSPEKIYDNDLSSIEVEKLNYLATGTLILLDIALIAGSIALIIIDQFQNHFFEN